MTFVFSFAAAFLTATTGWITVAFVAAQISLPYFLRRRPTQVGTGRPSQTPAFDWSRMWSHYLLGYFLAALAFTHAWIPMSTPPFPRTSLTGLWLATLGLGLIFVQVLVGIFLQRASSGARPYVRRIHFAIMLAISVLVLCHLWLNHTAS